MFGLQSYWNPLMRNTIRLDRSGWTAARPPHRGALNGGNAEGTGGQGPV